jgi:hypothetical protein
MPVEDVYRMLVLPTRMSLLPAEGDRCFPIGTPSAKTAAVFKSETTRQ